MVQHLLPFWKKDFQNGMVSRRLYKSQLVCVQCSKYYLSITYVDVLRIVQKEARVWHSQYCNRINQEQHK